MTALDSPKKYATVAGKPRARARIHDVRGVSSARTDAPDLSSDSPGNGAWDELLSAFRTMLTRAVGDHPAAPPALQKHEGEDPLVRPGVSACLATLDRLRTLHERDVSALRAALTQARADLAEAQAEETQARHQALHDGLTALPNRSAFLQQLDQALVPLGPETPGLAVLYLDLDDFKPINDSHGHDVGDHLLRIMAARLTRAVRAEDMVSRLGGDEFACLVAGALTRDQLSKLARKLIDAASASATIGSLSIAVHPSIGIATYPGDGVTAAALLMSADRAMYQAKRYRKGFAFAEQRSKARGKHNGTDVLNEPSRQASTGVWATNPSGAPGPD